MSCIETSIPEQPAEWKVEETLSGDQLLVAHQASGLLYYVTLACIKAIPGQASRDWLDNNSQSAGGAIHLTVVGEPQSIKDAPDRLIAEVFVDLGDGPQSLNEAQLLGGVARLADQTSAEHCPRWKAMQQAQAQAQQAKVGIWNQPAISP